MGERIPFGGKLIRREIADGHSFVCIGEEGDVVGTFCFIPGEDPAYRVIYEGAWLNDEPYALIHHMVIGCIIDILHIRSKLFLILINDIFTGVYDLMYHTYLSG